MSVLDEHGDWITHPQWAAPEPPWMQPTVRTVWQCDTPPQRAVVHILGVGVWHATVGGLPVSTDVLEPGVSDFDTRCTARSYDITSLLKVGANEFVVQLGEGPAHVRRAPGRYTKFTGGTYGPRVRVVLELDGALHCSDGTWQARLGPTATAHWYGGEDYDARLEPEGWLTAAGSEAAGWEPVAVVGGPHQPPVAWDRKAPAMRCFERLDPVQVRHHGDAITFAFGRNIAGQQRIAVPELPVGTTVIVRPAEYIDDSGRVDQCSTGSPIFDSFTSAGRPATWQPLMGYHGFQFLQLEMLDPTGRTVSPQPDWNVQALAVMTSDRPTGKLTLSDPVLQRIDDLITAAAQSNLMSVPTDCPHREKLGWLEQLHLVFGPLAFRWDVRDHFHDMVTHMVDAQTVDGLIPDIAPELVVFDFPDEPGFRDDVNWGGAIWHLPAALWRHYGTLAPARQAWEAGLRYLDYLDRQAGTGLLATGLGDWIALDESTPRSLVAGWGHARVLDSAATLAGALGRASDQRRMLRAASVVRNRLLAQHEREVASGSQAAVALLADADVLDPAAKARAVARLLELLRAGSDQLTVGEIGLPAVLRVLSEAGEHEAIYRFVTQTGGPGYGQMVTDGATALCEHWPGIRSRKSANHFMLGAIGDWFVQSLAGLRQAPGDIGWKRARLSPRPLPSLNRVAVEFDSPGGRYAATWERGGDGLLQIRVDVPDAGSAEIVPPPGWGGQAATVHSGTHELSFRSER